MVYFTKKGRIFMLKKRLILLLILIFGAFTLAGCGNKSPLTIWVGSESLEFYSAKMVEYVETYNATNSEPFPYEVVVKAVDSASAAATFLDDTDAGADIITIPHDNLGKLITGSSSVAPITSPALLAQISADNPEMFLQVTKGVVGGQEYTFGVPYVAQSLVLYYNKQFITPTQAQTWEGILAAATAANKQAVSLTGSDGFNNSFLLLARNAVTKETTLQLYENANLENNFGTGDDTIAKLKWGQRFFNHPNGARMPSDSGWEIELKDAISISVIGGAWNFKAAQAALGSNLAVTVLPQFTITAADAYGTVAENTVFQSGSFTDAKMFVMKKTSDKLAYLEDIMMFLSSKEVQEESYIAAANLPAYKNAITEFESMQVDSLERQLAIAQYDMFEYGIPQPFGANSRFNVYYYQKGAPDLIVEILRNTSGAFSTDAAILAQMQIVERVWKTGLKD
jgi:maltose-binding protein MalE